MRIKNRKKNSGFSLMEVVVTSAVLVIFLSVIGRIYYAGNDLWDIASNQADLQGRARIGLETMVRELRNASRTQTQNPSPNLSIPSVPNNKHIQFHVPEDADGNGLPTDAAGAIEWDTNNVIQYQYIPGLRVLRRLEKGEQRIIASDVEDVQFIDATVDATLQINELRIILTLSDNSSHDHPMTVTVTKTIALRN